MAEARVPSVRGWAVSGQSLLPGEGGRPLERRCLQLPHLGSEGSCKDSGAHLWVFLLLPGHDTLSGSYPTGRNSRSTSEPPMEPSLERLADHMTIYCPCPVFSKWTQPSHLSIYCDPLHPPLSQGQDSSRGGCQEKSESKGCLLPCAFSWGSGPGAPQGPCHLGHV